MKNCTLLKLLCTILVIAMFSGFFAGCSPASESASPSPTPTPSKAPVSQTPDSTEPENHPSDPLGLLENVPGYSSADIFGDEMALPGDIPPSKLPLTDSVTEVSIWALTPSASTNMVDFNDSPAWQELAKRLGVSFKFMLAASNDAQVQFNLMLAGGDYADIITMTSYYTAGGDHAVANDVYIALDDYTDYLPHYMALVDYDESTKKDSITDSGIMDMFHRVSYRDRNILMNGMLAREDLFRDYGGWTGEGMPETWGEWEDVLGALYDNGYKGMMMLPKDGCYAYQNNNMLSGLGMTHTWYLNKEGKVQYSRISDEYRTYLTFMRDWYDKGYVYQDFVGEGDDRSGGFLSRMMTADRIAIGNGWSAFAGTYYYDLGVATNPNFIASGIKDPVLNKGQKPMDRSYFGFVRLTVGANGWAVTTATEKHNNTELCMRLCDYMFSSEGILLTNYGVSAGADVTDLEHSFYYREDGRPVFTELITKNPDSIDFANVQQIYTFHTNYRVTGMTNEIDTFTDAQLVCGYTWADTSTDWDNNVLPANAQLSADESSESSAIMNDIATYVNEMTVKFILGLADIDTGWDAYVAQIESMNVARSCELWDKAVGRYLGRQVDKQAR